MARSRMLRLENVEQFAAINVLSDPGAIPGPKIVPSCAQIVLVWALASGHTGHNVLYGRYTGAFAGNVAQANAILAALTTGAQWTALAAFLANTCALNNVSIRDVNTPNAPLILSTATGSIGTSASPEMPNEVAVVTTLKTAFVGPAFRGRMYTPGWATNSLATGNVVAAAAVTALQNWANTIPTAFTGQGYQLVLGQPARAAYTGISGRQHPARAAMSTTISSLNVRDNHWDSQRRRGLR